MQSFQDGFLEEPGYLDYGAVGPISATVLAEERGMAEMVSRARYGSFADLLGQGERLQTAVAALTGFRADQVVHSPNTSSGLMHALFGLTGDVLLSAADFPSVPYAAVRAAEALHVVSPVWLETDHGRVTPGQIKAQLTPSVAAVAVCLVDSRTGYLADLEGIRQVIGDRLLIVDAIQGFGVVDAPLDLADVVATGGQKWTRAGWGTGFLALSDHATQRLTPVFSGFTGTGLGLTWDEVHPPATDASAFQISDGDPVALARFSAALEELDAVGLDRVQAAVGDNVSRIIELADEFAVPVVSSRDTRERAGIVILEPPAEQLTVLEASLSNHGVSVTSRGGRVRLSVHAVLSDATVDMVRAAFTSYSTAAVY